MLRSLEELNAGQEEILRSLREQSAGVEAVAVLPGPAAAAGVGVFARVCEVVATDPELGPHMLGVRQAWTGTPPVMGDADDVQVVCYPGPGHVVVDFAVDEIVQLTATDGAMLALKLA